MSFDFVNSNGYRNTGNYGAPVPNSAVMDGYGIPIQQNNRVVQQQPIPFNFGNQQPMNPQQRPMVDPRAFETPTIGEILKEEFMIPYNLSAYKLAKAIGVPVSRIQDILHNRRKITAETSIRLEMPVTISIFR